MVLMKQIIPPSKLWLPLCVVHTVVEQVILHMYYIIVYIYIGMLL